LRSTIATSAPLLPEHVALAADFRRASVSRDGDVHVASLGDSRRSVVMLRAAAMPRRARGCCGREMGAATRALANRAGGIHVARLRFRRRNSLRALLEICWPPAP